MIANANRPHGIFPMLYAFFGADGQLDRAAFRQQVEACIAAGAHGIAVLGLLTEVAALSPDERRTLVRWAVEDIAGRLPLMATIAGSTLDEVQALARDAEAAGATCLVVQPPLGQRPNGPELLEFYAAAFTGITIDVGIQNAPEYLGVGLTPAEVMALRQRHPTFTLMKGEGPVVHVRPFIDALGPGFAILNGRGGLELPDNLLAGCAGMVPAPDCADLQVAVYEAVQAGDLERAKSLYALILPYIVFSMQTLDVAILYGKQMFIRRAGIANAGACRMPKLVRSPFLDAALDRWSAAFGPYPTGR
jgi:4-hydroxy-tetrahydrodipicolinate synthase